MSAVKQPNLFEVFGRSQSTVVPVVNEEALTKFTDVLTESGEEIGKVVLLRSPRAGYGKTLLLQAASNRLNEDFRFLAVEPSGGGRIDGEVVLESVVRQLSEVLPASGGLTEFDLFARRLLALGLKPLLISGEIPSHDREGALFAIENRPIETFDFHHQQAATAHWTQSNFEVLGPRLTSELSELSGCSLRGCAYWVDLLFRYATTPPEKVERTRLLTAAIFGDVQGQSSLAEERLQSLLSLLALNEPIVLVFDETEGLSNQPEAGLRVAAFIVQLRQACPALTVVLSLNDDVWQTGLSPLMPGGLEDRLTEFEVVLEGLSREGAESLLRSRFGEDAAKISKEMAWPDPIFSRAVLKEASKTARKLGANGSLSSAESFELENPKPILPPPLEVPSADQAPGESYQEKADRRLEPSNAFNAEATDAFEAEASTESSPSEDFAPAVSSPTFDEKSAELSSDPFAEAASLPPTPETTPVVEQVQPSEPSEPAAVEPEPEPAAGSPFEIVPEKTAVAASSAVAASAAASLEAEPAKSPFEAVEEKVADVVDSKPETAGWSPESAVEHFAAAQDEAPKSSAESPFSEAEKSLAQEEKSPFEIHKEKERLAAATRVEEQSRRVAEEVAPEKPESSPFVVSETPPALPEQTVAVASPPQQPEAAESSPFSVTAEESKPVTPPQVSLEPTSRIEVTHRSSESPSPEPSSPEPVAAEVRAAPAPQTAAVPQQAAPTPAQESPSAPESPFAASASAAPIPSPFSKVETPATAATSATQAVPEKASPSQESEDVEELLSQFKKRFGQSSS